MKAIGYFMITLAFIAGAFFTVLHPTEVQTAPFLVTIVGGIVGIVLARTATRKEATSESALTSGIENVRSSLDALVTKADDFESRKEKIDTYDLRHHIDEHFRDDIETFVDARESIAHTHGLQAYAHVMSHFAAAERYLNRVWSASTDGYIDEAHTYIGKSAEQFREARDRFAALGAG